MIKRKVVNLLKVWPLVQKANRTDTSPTLTHSFEYYISFHSKAALGKHIPINQVIFTDREDVLKVVDFLDKIGPGGQSGWCRRVREAINNNEKEPTEDLAQNPGSR